MPRKPEPTEQYEFALERLLDDEDADFIIDAIPSALVWVARQTGSGRIPGPPFEFQLKVTDAVAARPRLVSLRLTWDLSLLRERIPDLDNRLRRLRTRRSADREHITELAAYVLAFVAIALFLPYRRVADWKDWAPPDILFEVTPSALVGVEVAGRSSGGWAALAAAREEKRARLLERHEIAEVYLSLWCATPRRGEWMKVKP